MKQLIIALVFFCFTGHAAKFSEKEVTDYGQSIEMNGLKWFAPKVDETISQVIQRSVDSLTDQGYGDEANQIWDEYLAHYDSYVTAQFTTHHQGDHKMFLAFLDKVWQLVFTKVCGSDWDVAKALKLDSIYILNYSIVPVFQMCTFDLNGLSVDREAEVRRHFAKDDDSRALFGLVPLVTYFAVEAGCLSAGGSLLCGIAANLAERFMGNVIAPKLSDKLFVRACGG